MQYRQFRQPRKLYWWKIDSNRLTLPNRSYRYFSIRYCTTARLFTDDQRISILNRIQMLSLMSKYTRNQSNIIEKIQKHTKYAIYEIDPAQNSYRSFLPACFRSSVESTQYMSGGYVHNYSLPCVRASSLVSCAHKTMRADF